VKHIVIIAGLAASLLTMPAKAAEWTQNGVAVICPWAEATQPGATSAPVYMWISARSQGNQRLIDALSEVAQGVEIDGFVTVGGELQRVRLQHLPVEAGTSLQLAPGGYHLLLTGLNTPLVPGPTFGMLLNFEPAGGLEIQVQVVPIGESPPCAPGAGVEPVLPGPPPVRVLPVLPPRWIPRGSF
jgi:periplasmic copper chaperone A